MSQRTKDALEIIDPDHQHVVEMVKELREYSRYNQAIALMQLRKKDPRLTLKIVRMLNTTLSPGTASERNLP